MSVAVIAITFAAFYAAKYSSKPKAGLPTGLYTMKQRIGIGIGCQAGTFDATTKNQPVWYRDLMNSMGAGWFFNWSTDRNCNMPTGEAIPLSEFDFLPVVGGYGSTYTDANCKKTQDFIRARRGIYRPGMLFVIGNEMGLDYPFPPETYADDYARWSQCMKDVDSSFKIGFGAVPSLYFDLPAQNWGEKTTIKGIDYIRRAKKAYDAKYGKPLAPDAFVTHAYYFGYIQQSDPVDKYVAAFKTAIADYRNLMKEFGWQNAELIINEFSPLEVYSGDTVFMKRYINEVNDYLANATDSNTGNPSDNYRLVQKWAWFIMNKITDPKHNDWKQVALAEADPAKPMPGLRWKEIGKALREKTCSLGDANRYPSIPACSYGQQLFSNPHFTNDASGWMSYQNENLSAAWEKDQENASGVLQIASKGNGNGGWCQTLTGIAGKTLRFSGRLTSSDANLLPYISINTISAKGTVNNFGGIARMQSNSCGEVSKEVTIPTDVEKINACFYVWGAPAGVAQAKWLSLCQTGPAVSIGFTKISPAVNTTLWTPDYSSKWTFSWKPYTGGLPFDHYLVRFFNGSGAVIRQFNTPNTSLTVDFASIPEVVKGKWYTWSVGAYQGSNASPVAEADSMPASSDPKSGFNVPAYAPDTKTWTVSARVICPSGGTLKRNVRPFWAAWIEGQQDNNFSWKNKAYSTSMQQSVTVSNRTASDHIYFGLESDLSVSKRMNNGKTVNEPLELLPSGLSYAANMTEGKIYQGTWFDPPTAMTIWSRTLLPNGTYYVNFTVPAAYEGQLCNPATLIRKSTPVPPSPTPDVRCPAAKEMLSNSSLTSAAGWTGYNNGNVAVGWETAGLRITSSGNGSGGWCRSVTRVAGKTLRFSGLLEVNNALMRPYLSVNANTRSGIVYNYQGIASLINRTSGVVSKTVTMGSDIDRIEICYYVWGAPAGSAWAKWLSLCSP